MRRPLTGITVSYILGTAAGILRPFPLAWLLALTVLWGLAGWGLWVWRGRSPAGDGPETPGDGDSPGCRAEVGLGDLCAYAAIFFLAWSAVGFRYDAPFYTGIRSKLDRPREQVELTGIVGAEPEVLWHKDGIPDAWVFPLEVESLRRTPRPEVARETVRVRYLGRGRNTEPRYGERWIFSGVLTDASRDPAGDASPRRRVSWLLHPLEFSADGRFARRLSAGQGNRFFSLCFNARRSCAETLELGMADYPRIAAILKAMLLGYRQELSPELRRIFIASGTYHVFAISGQHVVIIGAFIIAALSACRLPQHRWILFLAPLLIGFTVATGMQSSAIRACLMGIVYFAGPLFKRKPDALSSLMFTALLILAFEPAQALDPGFLLSFVVVLGLILLCPPVFDRVRRWTAPDPYRLQPESAATALGRDMARHAGLLIGGSLVAWLVATPLTAFFFGQFSWIAIPANWLAIPVSSVILLAGCLSVVFGACWPLLGEIFNFANVALVSFLVWAMEGLVRVPTGYRLIVPPPLWLTLLSYAALAAVFWNRTRPRVWIPVLCIFLAAVAVDRGVVGRRATADVLNLDGTTAVIARFPGADPILINTGPGRKRLHLAQILRRQSVNRLSALVLTSGDPDSIGGASDVLVRLPVAALWLPAGESKGVTLRAIRRQADQLGIPLHEFAPGRDPRSGSGAGVAELGANGSMRWEEDFLELRYGDATLRLMSRAGPTNAYWVIPHAPVVAAFGATMALDNASNAAPAMVVMSEEHFSGRLAWTFWPLDAWRRSGAVFLRIRPGTAVRLDFREPSTAPRRIENP